MTVWVFIYYFISNYTNWIRFHAQVYIHFDMKKTACLISIREELLLSICIFGSNSALMLDKKKKKKQNEI